MHAPFLSIPLTRFKPTLTFPPFPTSLALHSQGGFRMPGIVHWPGRVPANKTSNAIVHTMDIFPTIAALAGVRVPHDRIIDGL